MRSKYVFWVVENFFKVFTIVHFRAIQGWFEGDLRVVSAQHDGI